MLFIGIVVEIIIGLILKGKITNLAELKLQGFSLVLISLAVQLAILATPLATLPWLVQNGNLIYTISMAVLLLASLQPAIWLEFLVNNSRDGLQYCRDCSEPGCNPGRPY